MLLLHGRRAQLLQSGTRFARYDGREGGREGSNSPVRVWARISKHWTVEIVISTLPGRLGNLGHRTAAIARSAFCSFWIRVLPIKGKSWGEVAADTSVRSSAFSLGVKVFGAMHRLSCHFFSFDCRRSAPRRPELLANMVYPISPNVGCTRYGASLRKQIKKMEVSQHAKYFCEFCGKYAVKRKAVGIWGCKDCGKVKAGGAYTLKLEVIARLDVVNHRDATNRVGAWLRPVVNTRIRRPPPFPFPLATAALSMSTPAMEVDPPLDLAPVLEAASEFASYPGSSPSARTLFSSLAHSAPPSLDLGIARRITERRFGQGVPRSLPPPHALQVDPSPFSPFPSPPFLFTA
ncbi:hypothetical protein B296_00032565 [Ensete ventricosum]|uniref:60S ribosomal protein L37a n=1 Tax=Ensete ventricosum TaxID=4639 RepID=A0A427AA24_ENSVE|nr:hypothetical protein B296_00032565 [Ensete ventricosum]